MLIIGAKGFAKEILEIFHQNNDLQCIAFYDDVNSDINGLLYNQFLVLKNARQVKQFFLKSGYQFTIGVGGPCLRYKLYKKFLDLGGTFTSAISNGAKIGSYDVNIGVGANILANVIISNSVNIGIGIIAYYNVVITHDCIIDDFVELSPNVQILGRCKIGKMTHIGANATILPDITIGDNVVIGAGSVVTKNIPSNSVAVGTPAKLIKQL